MKEMQKKALSLKKIYVFIIFIMIVLIGIAYAVIDTPGYELAKGQTPREISAQSHMVSSGEFDMYQFVLDSEEDYDNCLLFYTNHQEVHVYSSGKLIYSREKSDSPFGHTTGDIWNQVEIPNGATVITVMITPVYSKIIQRNFQFYLGNYMVMNQFIIHESFLNLLVCFMIILVGSCATIFWLFSRRRDRPMDEVLYLGILIELLGFWSLGENLFVVYIGQNRAAASYFSHTCLMLAGVPFVLFFRKFLHLHDKYIYRIVTGYCLIQMFVCQILQFFNIYDLKETTIFTHVMIVLCFGYVIGGIGLNLIRGRHTRKTIINLVGILILGMSTGMDMITYYLDREHANQIGKFGLLLFTVLLGIETVRQAQKYLDEDQHLQIYREMAIKDMMTGCYNRNAYDEDINKQKEQRQLQIITFDLNELKRCNDHYGHQAGDKYICDAASIIREVYGKYGRVYRIGGDEFCIIAHRLSENRLRTLHTLLASEVREYNCGKPVVKMGIACGWAAYDEQMDQSIEDVRSRADEKMYEDKKKLKEEH